jgi:ApaG protein
VVGKQPILAPGESFEYRSYCPLRTAWGTMEGSYAFADPAGEGFEASVGRFFLVPAAENSIVSEG